MQRQLISQHWTLRAADSSDLVPSNIAGRDISATVPGCVHTDLLAAGLIEDPYLADNETRLQWIGETNWRYTCSFEIDPSLRNHERIDLVFDGLDTIATVELNGQTLGNTQDMHLCHRFNVKSRVVAGINRLTVTFSSPLKYARAAEQRLGTLPAVGNGANPLLPHNFIRKMACNFGWDWGPQLVTSGIWKPVRLEAWNTARIAAVRPQVISANADRAEVDVHVDIERAGNDADVHAVVYLDEGAITPKDIAFKRGSISAVVRLQVEKPKLWWPRGHGAQPRYVLRVELGGANQTPLDKWSEKIGLRTARLRSNEDKIGREFVIEVNGKPIFIKGVNWIPDDCFPHRVTAERYRTRIEQGIDAGINLLRVWGGGIFESDAFYDICDELGVLVWQDFLFACAMYPEEAPYPQLVEQEARQNVARLCRHPSLVLWNGCNENLWGYLDWNWEGKKWKDFVGERTWGAGYYFDLLPKLIAELTPSVPYWPGSPFPGTLELKPNQDQRGPRHVWELRHEGYRSTRPRMVSEFGHQAPPTFATLARVVSPDQRYRNSPAMHFRQRADLKGEGNRARLDEPVVDYFDLPENFDDWTYLTQVIQARAISCGVEWWRSLAPACMGTIYWQLNDCWPVSSWASIDGDGRKKPLWFATRRFYAERLISIQPETDGRLFLCAMNDTDQPWRGSVQVQRMYFDGGIVAEDRVDCDVAARSVQRIAFQARLMNAGDPAGELIAATLGNERALWFFDADRDIAYPTPQFDAALTSERDVHRLTITAKSLLRDLCVFVDRIDPDATIDDAMITLLPGERKTFTIRSGKAMTKQQLIERPVLQVANAFGSRKC